MPQWPLPGAQEQAVGAVERGTNAAIFVRKARLAAIPWVSRSRASGWAVLLTAL
jgi:hypothetical protein